MALRTSSSAAGASQISPLRTPRDRDWPRPTMLSAPSELSSPTTAQTLEVPISSPTMMVEESNISSSIVLRFGLWRGCGRDRASLEPAGGDIIGDGEVEGGDDPVHFDAPFVNRLPAPQLLVNIS